MNKLVIHLINNYNAVVIDSKYCEDYMDIEDKIITALSLPDKKKNFELMSAYDFEAFSPEEKAVIKEQKEAPFEEPLLILYETAKGELNYKIVNGMLSKIFELV